MLSYEALVVSKLGIGPAVFLLRCRVVAREVSSDPQHYTDVFLGMSNVAYCRCEGCGAEGGRQRAGCAGRWAPVRGVWCGSASACGKT